jgi:beta-barrel assembly-enhancing protease
MAASVGAAAADPFRPSIKDQIGLGKKVKEQVLKEEKVLPPSDPRSQELTRLGEMLVRAIPEKSRKDRPFTYSFQVIDSSEVNAFAVPGGPIFFYTGLLDKLQTEDQVAGILAHEIVHVQNMHWASAYADNMKRRMGLSILLGLLNAGDAAYTVADLADTFLVGLPYSRKHENEADRDGFRIAVAAGMNPTGLLDVMRVLKASAKGRVDEWMSTHPDTDRRIVNLDRMIKSSSSSFRPQKPRSPLVLPQPSQKSPAKPEGQSSPPSRLSASLAGSCSCPWHQHNGGQRSTASVAPVLKSVKAVSSKASRQKAKSR